MAGATMGMGLLNAYNKSGGATNWDGSPNYNNYSAQTANPYAGYNAAANGGWGIE
jgi:hypothetical protein